MEIKRSLLIIPVDDADLASPNPQNAEKAAGLHKGLETHANDGDAADETSFALKAHEGEEDVLLDVLEAFSLL